MPRTITVKGTGQVSRAPDRVVLSLTLQARHLEYGRAIAQADTQLTQLRNALAQAGFDPEELKTANFHVNTEYEYVTGRDNIQRREFTGYTVAHALKLAFDFDRERLALALSAIAQSPARPELHIAFTVKNPAAVQEALLKDAAKNARETALILCGAAGESLGQLLSIDYSWGEIDVFSNTRLMKPSLGFMEGDRAMEANISPEDIEVSDTATFIWELR